MLKLDPIRLCTFDVDETLLDDQQRIPPILQDALQQCRRRGIRLSLATGRMFEAARPYLQAIRADAPAILYNGARVQDPDTGAVLYGRTVDLTESRRVLALVKQLGLHVNLYLDDSIFIERESPVSLESARKDGIRQRPVGDLASFLDHPPTKLLIIGPGPTLERLGAMFDAQPHSATVVRSEPTYLEILPAGVTKGTALQEVSRITGVPLSQIAAFGDSNNDTDMLIKAGLGVAVGNAIDAVKAAADYVAEGRNGTGVAEALFRFVLVDEDAGVPLS